MAGATLAPPRFSDHLSELRSRLLFCVLTLVLASACGYLVKDDLLGLVLKPLNQTVFYTAPAGGFSFVIQICLFFGMVASIPIVTYNLLRFVEPALPPKVSSRVAGITLMSCVLSLLGIAFAYFISLPAALIFLDDFSTESVQSLISAGEYFSFVTRYLGGFALVFQLPLALITINRVTPLRVATLMQKQGVVLLLSFLIAAILTPTPDPINQAIMAAPIVILYQFAVLWIWIANRKLPAASLPQETVMHRPKTFTDIRSIKR